MIKFLSHKRQAGDHTQAGISLLEVLLSVGIGAVIVLGAVRIAYDWAERVRHRDEASYLLSVSNAAQAYVSTNFGAIMQDGFHESLADNNSDGVIDNADLVNIGRAIMVPMDDEGTGFYLKDGTIGLRPNYPSITPSGRDVRVYVRNLGFIGKQRTLEILTVTSLTNARDGKPMPELDVRDIAQAIGPEGGIYKTTGSCQSGVLQSVYGSWEVGSDTISQASKLMPGVTPYCPARDVSRGVDTYVALQSRLTYESGVSRDYLYRVAIPGAPELNSMETNIDMNSHPVLNVASMSVDNLQVRGNALISGQDSGAALYVDEGLRVAGNESFIAGRRETDAMGTSRIVGGGNIQANNLNAINLQAPGAALNADTMLVRQRMTVGGNLGVGEQLDVSGTLSSGQVVAPYTAIRGGGSVTAQNFEVAQAATINNLTATNATATVLEIGGTMNATTLEAIGGMAFGSESSLQGGLTANQVQMRSLGACQATTRWDWQRRDFIDVSSYDCKVGP